MGDVEMLMTIFRILGPVAFYEHVGDGIIQFGLIRYHHPKIGTNILSLISVISIGVTGMI